MDQELLEPDAAWRFGALAVSDAKNKKRLSEQLKRALCESEPAAAADDTDTEQVMRAKRRLMLHRREMQRRREADELEEQRLSAAVEVEQQHARIVIEAEKQRARNNNAKKK